MLDGQRLPEVNRQFAAVAKRWGFYSTDLIREIAERGSIQDMGSIPEGCATGVCHGSRYFTEVAREDAGHISAAL